MKGFQFKLEQLLQHRKKKEEQALLEQSKARQECDICQRQLAGTQKRYDDNMRFSETVSGSDETLRTLLYRDQLQILINRQKKQLQKVQEIFQVKQRETLKACQERMVLERLKEKKLVEFKEFLAILEQKEIDEMATLGFGRKAF
ncbi:flagellar export protein FliJ [Desulfotomaculum sp. 1211_IL3151]|uniref:flagellar export protein FliJ n=1 Tax=Desulfotomaculum sp. 1211_IL3151 TaxID=3084055 RepID=UPI002FD9C281